MPCRDEGSIRLQIVRGVCQHSNYYKESVYSNTSINHLNKMKSLFLAGFIFFYSPLAIGQDANRSLPIIDMHLHALPADFLGPPPLAFCLPSVQWPAKEWGTPYSETFMRWEKDPKSVDPNCDDPIWSPTKHEEIMRKTLEIMERRNVIGVTSGPLVQAYKQANPDRIIKGLMFNLAYNATPIDSLRLWFTREDYQVFGEVTNQYAGIKPDDERFEPYVSLAEELDIPIGIHIGPGPPGVAYINSPHYRASLHDPLLLEEVLFKHPDLRLYICHAGWPMIDNLLALMYTHPQVYVDLGVISFAIPPPEFHRYLKRIVEAGFGNRVMFGSDQMVWPEALEIAIETIEKAEYLSEKQKRDIFYNNAARFLKLNEEEIAKHHGK